MELTKVVVRFKPFHRTAEVETKFEPVTVSVMGAAPWAALAGDIDVRTGAGLFGAGGGALITNESDCEMPPPGLGLDTDTGAKPAAAMSAAGIVAVSCVALTNVVGRSRVFQRTMDPLTKFEPVTVIEKAGPPAVALLGAMDATEGVGLVDCAPS